jgi:hypothetical protein
MDKTNYPILSIVAVVALTAIVAMFMNAQRNPVEPIGPVLALTDGFDGALDGAALTGNVALERATRPVSVAVERARPDVSFASYDYNDDGRLDEEDGAILDLIVARERFCPQGKTCDVNQDGVVDVADRRVYYNAIQRFLAEEQDAREALLPKRPAAPQEDEFWFGVIGAPVQ